MRIGFLALADAAPVLMAHELGLYAERGVAVELVRCASWPAVRDGLLDGRLDAAHGPFSLPLSVAAGVSGAPDGRLQVAMVLSSGGQGITLRAGLAAAGYGDPARAGAALAAAGRPTRLAVTYPGGTHDVWLRYWLRVAGVPRDEVEIVAIPPPQMVAHMRGGSVDGCCVGEPWNAVAAQQGVGFTALVGPGLWPGQPEKALLVAPAVAARRRGELAAAMGAILAAAARLDDAPGRRRAAATISRPAWVNAPASAMHGRLSGRYDLGGGLGRRRFPEPPMRFHDGGTVNAPRRRDAVWFLAQFQRLGLIGRAPDRLATADELLLRDLYAEVAAAEGVPVPGDDMAPVTASLDGARFDPADAAVEVARP